MRSGGFYRFAHLALGLAGALALAGSALAAPSTKIGTASLISPSAADTYFGAATAATNSTGAGSRPAEIQELARALKNDPDLIYEYVRNNTAIVWTYGLTKGGMGVIVDRAGTAFDQAHLMVELLRQAGFTASYKLGTVTLTGAQFASWSGITSATAACQLLSSGGIPAAINGSTTANCSYGAATVSTIDISHAWVSVVIQGVSYVYDPAFKDHTFTTGMNLGTATSMSTGALMGVSNYSGTTSGIGWVSTVGSVTSSLNTYASNLETAMASSLPAASVADVVGGQAINPQIIPSGGLRQTSLPYTANVLRTITGDMPNQYRTSLRVQVNKVRPSGGPTGVIDKTLYVDEIYGRRLVFDPNFDTSGATFNGALKLIDDFGTVNSLATTGSYSDNPTYSRGDVTLTVNLPYAASSGAYMDAVVTRTVSYALPFTVVHGWGDTGRGLIDKWGQRRDTAMPAVPDASCKVCFVSYKTWKGDGRRELLAAEWLAQASKAARLHAAIAKGIFAQHYSIGVSSADTTVFQTSNGSYWITDSFDRLDIETGFSLTSTSATATDRRAAVLATAATLATLKGNVSAQVSDLPDNSSTATRFEWGNAPPSAEDAAGGTVRPFYLYTNTTDAAQAMGLSKTENLTTTTDTGLHDQSTPTIGSTETVARRQAVSDAVTAYTTAGFSVAASGEAFLGPGQRGGGFAPSTSYYSHASTPQRGGALVATKYDGNGDPTEIAHVVVNPGGIVDGGGGGAQLFHQVEYDPATAADVVKGRFVNAPVGSVTAASPAKVVVGRNGFPYQLTGQLIWRDGEVREETYGAAAHREPQMGWTTSLSNTLTISGSGLEAMGESDARAATGTIAAFYAAQDVYKSTPSLKRDVVAELVSAAWSHNLTQNVASVNVGTETRQFIRKPAGTWFSPGPGSYATLVQTGSPAVTPRHPNGYSSCNSAMILYVPTRGWSYSGVSFALTGPTGEVQTFGNWTNQVYDTSTTVCGEQRGFRLTNWDWLNGASLTFNYARPSGNNTFEVLSYVTNNFSQRLNFTNAGFGGFTNNLTSTNLRQVTVSQTGSVVSHTDPIGAVSKFDIATVGTGDFARTRLATVYAADSATTPALQYVYDTLARVAQVKDRLVLAGSRAPSQYLLANGFRGETLDALGYSSIVYANLDGQPIRSIDPLGAVSTTTYDGRGRPLQVTSADGDRVQFEYNSRNLPTKQTVLARAGSAEAGQTLVTETGWHATLSLPTWTKDAKAAQTDYTYSAAQLTQALYPPAQSGATRMSSNNYYYSGGLTLSAGGVLGEVVSATYGSVSVASLTDTVGSTYGTQNITSDAQGDPTDVTSPRSAHTNITYDALRRPTLVVEPLVGSAPRVAKRMTYDLLGRVTQVERGSYVGTTFTPLETYSVEFDAVGNKVKDIGPARIAQYSYDALNRPVCTAVRMNAAAYGALPADACQLSPVGTFGSDRISRATYDAAGRVVQTEAGVGTDLQQVTARFGYSAGGQKTSLTDANGNMSVFEYDGFARLKKLRYPASPRGSGNASTTDYEEYGYDANGNKTSLRKRDGTTIAWQYDALNRVTVKDLPGTTADDVYYAYVNNGRQMEGRLGSSTATLFHRRTFDEAGRLTGDWGWNTISSGTTNTGYQAGFDAEGNRTLAWLGNSAVSYTYDVVNRLTAVTYNTWPNQPLNAAASYTYGPLNRRTSVIRPNGANTTYSYDAAGRLVGLTHGDPSTAGSAGFSQTLSYNPAGQVLGTAQSTDPYVWSGQPVTTTNFTHDALNRDSAIAAASGYDANGNLISDGVRTFTYDAENRLRSVTGGSATATLNYDPFGRLETVTANGATTTFRYAGPLLVGEYDMSNSNYPYRQLREYIYADSDQPLLWVEGAGQVSQTRWFHQDQLGSVIATSTAGTVTPYTYGPYGEPQTWAGSRFRYTGQIAIPEAQLYHYRARAYDPMMGRFLQTDPIGYGDGPNIYAYVHGDPVNGTDPSGHSLTTTMPELVVTGNRDKWCHICELILDDFLAAQGEYILLPSQTLVEEVVVIAEKPKPVEIDAYDDYGGDNSGDTLAANIISDKIKICAVIIACYFHEPGKMPRRPPPETRPAPVEQPFSPRVRQAPSTQLPPSATPVPTPAVLPPTFTTPPPYILPMPICAFQVRGGSVCSGGPDA